MGKTNASSDQAVTTVVKARKRVSSSKVKFSAEEDEMLRKLVAKHGETQWDLISSLMPRRNPRQCHDRWVYYISPSLNHTRFTQEEDRLLIQKYEEYGRCWVKIASYFRGRTDTMIKNRFNLIKRKFFVPSIPHIAPLPQPFVLPTIEKPKVMPHAEEPNIFAVISNELDITCVKEMNIDWDF